MSALHDARTLLAKPRVGQSSVLDILAALVAEIDDAPTAETVRSYRDGLTAMRGAYIPAGTYKLVCIETPKD